MFAEGGKAPKCYIDLTLGGDDWTLCIFGRLRSVCEEITRVLLTCNRRSGYVFYQVSFPAVGTVRWSSDTVIRQKYLWSDREYYSLEKQWKYAPLHTHVYCLSSHQQNKVCFPCSFTERSPERREATPLFVAKRFFLSINKTRLDSFVTSTRCIESSKR